MEKTNNNIKTMLFNDILKYRIAIIIVFLILTGIATLLWPRVEVDYDINDYLPEDAESTISLNLMEEEFSGNIPGIKIMVKDVSLAEALQYKESFQAVDGVTDVTWLDDAIDITEPLETADDTVVEDYYKDNNALYSISVKEEKRLEAVDSLRDIIGDANAMAGSDVNMAVATESTVSEIQLITIFAILFILLILALTTSSWAEPIIILLCLGVGVVLNAGSNLIFGTISFVTNAAGTVLQLAISLDFSVFLIHRYDECRGKYGSPLKDMVAALSKSATAISSSAITVMMGFLALTVMRFEIGADLGIALAKGILISFITVFTLTPSVYVVFDKLIRKFDHKPIFSHFNKLGIAVSGIMLPLAIVFTILPFIVLPASLDNNYYYGSSHIFGTDTQLGSDTQEINELFGVTDTYVVMVPRGNLPQEVELSQALRDIPEVSSVISYADSVGVTVPEEYLPEETLNKLMSDNYSRMILTVDCPYEGDKTFECVEAIEKTIKSYYPGEWYLAGEGVSTYDLKNIVSEDMIKVDILAIAAVLIVLFFALRNFLLPVILVLVIETSIWLNLSIPHFTGSPVFYLSYLIITAIQLGVSVDYAILFTDRFREYRRVMNKKESLIHTVANTTVPICTSGFVLTFCGFMIGIISTHGILSQIGMFLGKGTLISLIAVIFILPGYLCIFDTIIDKMDWRRLFQRNKKIKINNK